MTTEDGRFPLWSPELCLVLDWIGLDGEFPFPPSPVPRTTPVFCCLIFPRELVLLSANLLVPFLAAAVVLVCPV